MTSKFICKKCDFTCCKQSNWDNHTRTKKHNSDNNNQHLFECVECNYTCQSQSIMDKHKKTAKHIHKCNLQNVELATPVEQTKDSELMSIIKELLTQNSDLKNFIIEQSNEHKKETTEIVNKVIEQAKETTGIISKVIEQSKPINNTITNNNNKAFNINLFLTEQCKDAMNFSDFINSIEVSHEDLENTAQLGFVGGISKIFIDGLKELNQNERPIHCTDVKRETMYIKDDNKWTKEENDAKLRSAIQEVTRKSMGTLMNWKQENPDYKDSNSEFSNRCITIQRNSLAGSDRETYYPKVIHAIAREVLVSK